MNRRPENTSSQQMSGRHCEGGGGRGGAEKEPAIASIEAIQYVMFPLGRLESGFALKQKLSTSGYLMATFHFCP